MAPVYLPGFVNTAAGAVAAPTLTLLAVELGGGKAAAGTALSLRALATLVAQVPAGRLLAALGARTAMVGGGAVSALGAALVAVAAGRRSFVVLQLSLLLHGLGQALWEVGRQAQIQRAVPAHVRGKAVALYGGVVRVAAVGGPMLGGLLQQRLGTPAVFATEAGLVLLAAAAALGFMPAHKKPPAATGKKKRRQGKEPRAPSMFQTLLEHHARFLTAGVASALLSIVRHARSIALPLVGQEIGLSATQIGACLSAAMAIEAPMFIPAGWAYDRFGRKPVVVPGAAIIAMAWAALTQAETRGGLLFAASLLGVGNGLMSGAGTLTCQDFAPGDSSPHTPNYFALWNVLTGLATMAAPTLIGGASQRWSVSTAAGITAALAAAAAAWFGLAVPEMKYAARVERGGRGRRPAQ